MNNIKQYVIIGKYRIIRLLGSGSYGEVFEAEDIKTNQKVAIKKISNIFATEETTKRLLRELYILRILYEKHSSIINLINILPPDNLSNFEEIYLVFEMMEIDLHKLMNSEIYLEDNQIKRILYQILTGTHFLHSAGICHRDLKPANILLNNDLSVKLCDFGLSRGDLNKGNNISRREEIKRKLTSHMVTRWYRAPELIILYEEYSLAIDIWSIGCIFAELLQMNQRNVNHYKKRKQLFTGLTCYPLSPHCKNNSVMSTPFDQLSVIVQVIGKPTSSDIVEMFLDSQSDYILNYMEELPPMGGINFEERFPSASNDAIDLLKGMLKFNPSKRFTTDEALSHVYFSDIRDVFQEMRYPKVDFYFENLSMKIYGRTLVAKEIIGNCSDLKLMLYQSIIVSNNVGFKRKTIKVKKKKKKVPRYNDGLFDTLLSSIEKGLVG